MIANIKEINNNNNNKRCEICSKITIKTPFLTLNMYLFAGLNFYFLNHIQYFLNLDQFHCVHDLQKKWNLVYILILA